MRKVHLRPVWWAVGGTAAVIAVAAITGLSPAGWAVGGAYLAGSSILLSRGLRRHGASRLGPANAVTATRSAIVGVVAALVATSFTGSPPVPLLVALASIALALDGLDGYVARRSGSASELGARFDMEVDAFLILVLSVYDARTVGGWVLVLGLLRYAFVAASWVLPWMRRSLPARHWRKVAAAAGGIALTVAATGLLPPPVAALLLLASLGLLVESFGRDVIWLVRMNRNGSGLVSPAKTVRRTDREESRET